MKKITFLIILITGSLLGAYAYTQADKSCSFDGNIANLVIGDGGIAYFDLKNENKNIRVNLGENTIYDFNKEDSNLADLKNGMSVKVTGKCATKNNVLAEKVSSKDIGQLFITSVQAVDPTTLPWKPLVISYWLDIII